MNTFFDIMLAPFAECLVLVGIHSYLGIHVLKRRVIFVDLSLAQIAALGTTVGILFGIHDTDSTAALLMAMIFTVGGAGLFAMTRLKNDIVPQEAVIGLVYAVTAAVAVLVVEKTQGVEHLVNIMHGRLLWVRWDEVLWAAVLYSAIGVVHYVFRRQFTLISEHPEAAFASGMRVRLWDFFFYVTFGLTISMSVKVAGVLLVFVFLVAPAIIALLVTRDFKLQLVVGWVSGFVVTAAGLSLSWVADLPSGPTVVSFYGLVLVLVGLALYVIRAPSKRPALRHLGLGSLAVLASMLFTWKIGHTLADSSLAGRSSVPVFGELGSLSSAHAHGLAHGAEHDHHHDEVLAAAVPAVAEVPAEDDLLERYRSGETALDRLDAIELVLQQDHRTGMALLHIFLADRESPPFCRSGAVDLLKAQAGTDFGYDPDLDPVDNLVPLQHIQTFVSALP